MATHYIEARSSKKGLRDDMAPTRAFASMQPDGTHRGVTMSNPKINCSYWAIFLQSS